MRHIVTFSRSVRAPAKLDDRAAVEQPLQCPGNLGPARSAHVDHRDIEFARCPVTGQTESIGIVGRVAGNHFQHMLQFGLDAEQRDPEQWPVIR